MRKEKRKINKIYFYILALIVFAIVFFVAKHFFANPILPSPCYDDCTSLKYQCGEWSICGQVKSCGKCQLGMTCNSTGRCADIQIGLETEWGENKFWFVVFVIAIPAILIIIALFYMWIKSRNRNREEETGEVIRWGIFKKAVVEKGKREVDEGD